MAGTSPAKTIKRRAAVDRCNPVSFPGQCCAKAGNLGHKHVREAPGPASAGVTKIRENATQLRANFRSANLANRLAPNGSASSLKS